MKGALITYGDLKPKSGGFLYDKKLIEYLKEKGINIKHIPQKRYNYLENIKNNFSQEIIQSIEKNDLDFLIEDELNHISLFRLNKEIKKRFKIKIFSIVHHLSYLVERKTSIRQMKKFFEKKYLETIDYFIVNSEATKKEVNKLINDKTGFYISRPGKNENKKRKTIKKPDKKNYLRLLFVGNILPHKNIDTLIKAISDLDEIKLELVGNTQLDPDYVKKIKKIINQLKEPSRITLHGFLSENEKKKQFIKSDVLALPSYYEGYGIAAIEALGYGIPVIATKNGGTKELVKENKNGFLIDPFDKKEIKEKIKELLKKPRLLKSFSEEAKKTYKNHPTWEETFSGLPRLLNERIG